jgi:hypothetical protein
MKVEKRTKTTYVYIDNSPVMDNSISSTISEDINNSSTNIKQTHSTLIINTTKNKERSKRALDRKRKITATIIKRITSLVRYSELLKKIH